LAKKLLEGTLLPGYIFTSKGYLSTSIDRKLLIDRPISIHISVPQGAKGLYLGRRPGGPPLSANDFESELLMDRGVSLKILSADPENLLIESEIVPDRHSMWGSKG
jgi:hypothetical protein